MYPWLRGQLRHLLNETIDTSKRSSALTFGYAANLSLLAMKGRCPDSLFCRLTPPDSSKWHMDPSRDANVCLYSSDESDVVYGALQ